MQSLYIIPILAFLVIIHELGHFFAARSVGVKVEEFGIGIPPRIKGWRKGGVLWSLNAIPFGGFVRVKGEDAKDFEPGSMNAAGPWQRAWFLFAGPLMNLLVGLILSMILIATQGVPTDINPLYIGQVHRNTPAEEAGWLPGDRIISVNGVTVTNQPDASRAIRDNAGKQIEIVVQRGSETIPTTITPRENPPKGEGATGIEYGRGTLSEVSVSTVKDGSPAAAAGLRNGDQIIAINGTTIESIAQASGLMTVAQGTTVPLTIERDGQQQTIDLAVPAARMRVTEVAKIRPPDALLYKNDEIVAINGEPVTNAHDFEATLRANYGKSVELTWLREGREGTATLAIPRPDKEDQSIIELTGLNAGGVSPFSTSGIDAIGSVVYNKVPASHIVQEGWNNFWNVITQMVDSLRMMISGDIPMDQVTGPIGMGQITGELLKASPNTQLSTLANLTILISLSLGIFNLLPFPALDGGRLMFVILEILRGGKRIAPEKEGMVHMVGMMLLLALMFFIAFGDISRLMDGESLLP